MCREDPFLLRNNENYINDLKINNVSLTGIKEEFAFKNIRTLYCAGIGSVTGTDEFHDVPEGVVHYTMIPALEYFCSIIPNFLDTLNERMYMFDYGHENSRNRPPSISQEHLKKKS